MKNNLVKINDDKSVRNDERYLKMEWIKTKTAAKNFANLLLQRKNQTFFLDGKWGSGKTEYLIEVRTQMKDINSKVKFIDVDLWRVIDNKSVTHIVMKKVHKVRYLLINIAVFLIIFIVVSIMQFASTIITRFIAQNIELTEATITFEITCLIILIILCVLTCYTYIKVINLQIDDIYLWSLKHWNKKNKIVVFDDFDRVSSDRQEEAYKMFNLLHDKMTILFVGDYAKIHHNEDTYLQKIIDKRIRLPYTLHVHHIVSDLETKIRKLCSKDIKKNTTSFDMNLALSSYSNKNNINLLNGLSDLLKVFEKEDRTIREMTQFLELVNKEFIDNNKLDRVHAVQQLTLIYIYQFYPYFYHKLQSHWFPLQVSFGNIEEELGLNSNKLSKQIIKNKDTQSSRENDFSKLFFHLLTEQTIYIKNFQEDKEAYWIYELTSNLSEQEIISILSNPTRIYEHIKDEKSNDIKDWFWQKKKADLYKYPKYQKNFQKAVHQVVKEGNWSNKENRTIVDVILRDESSILLSESEQKVFDVFDSLLVNYDTGTKLQFYNRYLHRYNRDDHYDTVRQSVEHLKPEIDERITDDNFRNSPDKLIILKFITYDINNTSYDKELFLLNDNEMLEWLKFNKIVRVWENTTEQIIETNFEKIENEERRAIFQKRYEEIVKK